MFGWSRRRKRRATPPPSVMAAPDTKPLAPDGYRVFTKAFDRVVAARDLRAELEKGEPVVAQALADMWAKLNDPEFNRDRIGERARQFQVRWQRGHTLGSRPLITILADHSGSLRNQPAQIVARLLVELSGALEKAGIDFEVLGFTTSSWRGGKSRARWMNEFLRPRYPGRLCDLLHIVYRDAASPSPDWSRDLVLITSDKVLKENIDGEAILWAAERAERLNPSMWLCLCVTDGAPMDDSTVLANGNGPSNWYLQRHLEQVVQGFEADEGKRIGCLSLPPPEFHGVSKTYSTMLEGHLDPHQTPIDAFDVLEALIWPRSPSEEAPKTDLSSNDVHGASR
jgi:cobaltochelatase CobT